MDDVISRRVAIDAMETIGYIATMPDGDKCIRESAVKYTLSMLPSAQPETNEEHTETHACDCISRAAAIDALEREKTYSAVYKYGYTQMDYFKQYNMGLTDGIKALNKLPSAQPCTADIQKIQDLEQAEIEKAFELGREDAMNEIVRCKDCKHHHYDGNIPYCDNIDYGYGWYDNDFCSHAERREE